MRATGFILIVLALGLFADAAYDAHRELASTWTKSGKDDTVARAEDPAQYRNVMIYQWLRSSLCAIAGLVIIRICRRAERFDITSPDFAGDASVDEGDRAVGKTERAGR